MEGQERECYCVIVVWLIKCEHATNHVLGCEISLKSTDERQNADIRVAQCEQHSPV